MTPLPLFQPIPLTDLPFAGDWLRPLLRWLASRDDTRLPDDMEDWQLRDLALTRTYPGPCRFLTPWLP